MFDRKPRSDNKEGSRRPAEPARGRPAAPGVNYSQWVFGPTLARLMAGDAANRAFGAPGAVAAHRQESDAVAPDGDDPAVDAALGQAGRGEPLPGRLVARLEREHDVDFSRVHSHVDATADRAAQALHAHAFTVGEDIYFARGAASMDDHRNESLLAHELTHVLQYQQGRMPSTPGRKVSSPGDPLEREAHDASSFADLGRTRGSQSAAAQPAGPAPANASIFRQGSKWMEVGQPQGKTRIPLDLMSDVLYRVTKPLAKKIVHINRAEFPVRVERVDGPSAFVTLLEDASDGGKVFPKDTTQGWVILKKDVLPAGPPGAVEDKPASTTVQVTSPVQAPVPQAPAPQAPAPQAPAPQAPVPQAPALPQPVEEPGGTSVEEQIREALVRPNPEPTVGQTLGDHAEAYRLLNRQSMEEMLRVLTKLKPSGDFDNLGDEGNLHKAVGVNLDRIKAALKAVEVHGTAAASTFASAHADLVSGLPDDQKTTIADFLARMVYFGADSDAELGARYIKAQNDPVRRDAIEEEMSKREQHWPTPGAVLPPAAPVPGAPGTTSVTPDVALKLLENISRGEPPFKPELGKGRASWFVTEGNPHVGIDPAKSIEVPVEIAKTDGGLVFDEAALQKLFEQTKVETQAEAMAQYRQHLKSKFGIDAAVELSKRRLKDFARWHEKFAESRMWGKVGEKVAASPKKVGEVILQDSKFSRSGNGKFAVIADGAKVQLKGGPGKIIEALDTANVKAEPVVIEAAEATAKKLKWAGRVRTVFRVGGKIVIIVAVGLDLWKIYRAQDRKKAVIESVGGWAGSIGAGAAFAAWWAPADAAGPWAWAAHGVGTLVSGAVGYWVGSSITRTIYEIVVED